MYTLYKSTIALPFEINLVVFARLIIIVKRLENSLLYDITTMLRMLLLVSLLVAVVNCQNSSTPQLNITVSVDGDNGYKCHTHHYCKTLEYVFTQMAASNFTGNSSDVSILVTYNQTFTASRKFCFRQHYLKVTVSGHSIMPQIHFNKLQIQGGYSWRWERIKIINQQEYKSDEFTFSKYKFLAIVDCTARSSYLKMGNINNALLKGNNFDDSHRSCSQLDLSSAHEKSFFNYNITFIGNNVSHCTVTHPNDAVLSLSYHGNAIAEITNNHFEHIEGTKSEMLIQSGISIAGPGFIYIDVSNNTFIHNHLSFIDVNIQPLTTPLAQCFISGNTFDNNNVSSQDLQSQDLVNIFKVHYSLHVHSEGCTLKIYLTDNHICNNSGMYIGIVSAQADSGNTEMYVFVNEKNIRNNSVKTGLLQIEKTLPARYGNMTVDIQEFIAEYNTVDTIEVEDYSGLSVLSILYVEYVNIINATFRYNQGTPLQLQSEDSLGNTELNITGIVRFHKNIGLLGGACFLQNVNVHTSSPSLITFDQNHAKLGGALYLVSTELHNETCRMVMDFTGNTAITAGNTVFFATVPQLLNFNSCNLSLNSNEMNSLPQNLTLINEGKPHSLFPGENAVMNVSIIDYFGYPVSCTASVNLRCNGNLYTCFDHQVKLNGPTVVVIAQQNNTNYTTVDTNLKIASPEGYNNTKVSLLFNCRNAKYTKLQIPLNITECPLGFAYNSNSTICQCIDNSDNFICSQPLSTACAKFGYWFGQGATNDHEHTQWYFGECSYPECPSINSVTPCPSSIIRTADKYYRLKSSANDLCSEGRGGILCQDCASGFFFTFTSTACAPGPCTIWQPILIVFLSIMVYTIIAVLALFTVKLKLTVGSGFLYGPMLFLAVINSLSLDSYSEFTTLSKAISIISSIPLMNSEIFGYIPWCFVPSLGRIYNYTLRYIGPIVVLILITLASRIAKRFPTLTHRWMGSPLKAICILTLLSFWSLVDTSVHIIMYTKIMYTQNTSWHHRYVSSLQPNVRYFSMQHAPVAVPAILLQLVVIVPLLVLLMFSSLLSKRVNLHKIKPFLDEFQSCYKDRYRWFSVVFLVVWIITVCFSTIINTHPIVMQTLYTLVLTVLITIQPYQSKSLNTMDSLLLVDINLLIATLQSKYADSKITVVFVHLLIIGPLLGLIFWFTCVCLYKCGVHTKLPDLSKLKRRRNHSTTVTLNQSYDNACADGGRLQSPISCSEREPLIKIVNNQ